eukprot:SAG22_NODE_302_length_12743_cov_12.397738_5_plen_113_part_00
MLAARFGADWVPQRLQEQEDVAVFAATAAAATDVKSSALRPYTGQYVSVRVPASTIDSLRFYESCVQIEEGEDLDCHLRVDRLEESGVAFRELAACRTDVMLVLLDKQTNSE